MIKKNKGYYVSILYKIGGLPLIIRQHKGLSESGSNNLVLMRRTWKLGFWFVNKFIGFLKMLILCDVKICHLKIYTRISCK